MQSKTQHFSVTDFSIVTRSIADYSITNQLKRLAVLAVVGTTLLTMVGCTTQVLQANPLLAVQPITLLSGKATPTPTRKPSPTPTVVKRRSTAMATAQPIPTATKVMSKYECTMEAFETSRDPLAADLYRQGMEMLEKAQGAQDFLLGFPSADKAIDLFSEAIEIDAKFVGAYLKRAAAINFANTETMVNRADESQFELVISDLGKAIAIKPNCSILYLERAMTWTSQNKAKEAIADLDMAIFLDSESYDALSLRGFLHYGLWEWEESLEDLNRAEPLMPTNLDPERMRMFYNIREDIHYVFEMWDESIADCERWIEVFPDRPGGYLYRGRAYLAKGNADAAIRDFRKALEIDPAFTASELRLLAPKISELQETLSPDAEQYAELGKLISEFGPNSSFVRCDEVLAKYQTDPMKAVEYVYALEDIANVEWNLDTLIYYEEVVSFYIPFAKCFPEQVGGTEAFLTISARFREQLAKLKPGTEIYIGVENLITALEQ